MGRLIEASAYILLVVFLVVNSYGAKREVPIQLFENRTISNDTASSRQLNVASGMLWWFTIKDIEPGQWVATEIQIYQEETNRWKSLHTFGPETRPGSYWYLSGRANINSSRNYDEHHPEPLYYHWRVKLRTNNHSSVLVNLVAYPMRATK